MKIILFVLFFAFSVQLHGQIIESLLDLGFSPISHQFYKTNDHGYVLFATNSETDGYGYNKMIKFDSTGNVIWARNYSGGFHSAVPIGENNFAVYGFQDSITWPAIIYKIQLSVYDHNGFLQSAMTLPESLVVSKVHPVSDGGSIALPEQGNLIMKTDSTGNFEWIKNVDSIANPRVYLSDLIESASSGFIGLANYTYPDTMNSPSYSLLVRLNIVGDTMWTRSYENVIGHSIFNALGNCYIILGDGNWQQGYSSTITMLDSAGNLRWINAIPFGYWVNDFAITQDLNFIFSGFEFASAPKPFLLKTDTNGSILWMRKYPGGYNYRTLIANGPDSGFVLASAGNAGEVLIIFTDSTGASACDSLAMPISFSALSLVNTPAYHSVHIAPSLISPYPSTSLPYLIDSSYAQANNCLLLSNKFESGKKSIAIYPNPATSQFRVISKEFGEATLLEIYNMLGEKIYSEELYSSGQLTIDCRLFIPGIYFVRVTNSKYFATKKLLIE